MSSQNCQHIRYRFAVLEINNGMILSLNHTCSYAECGKCLHSLFRFIRRFANKLEMIHLFRVRNGPA